MRQVLGRTSITSIVAMSAVAFVGCTTPPEKPAAPPPPVAVAPQPPKSVMFDSDPNGEWNLFPDPTTGEVGIYHKGNLVGSVDGKETEEPPEPHPSPNQRPEDDTSP